MIPQSSTMSLMVTLLMGRWSTSFINDCIMAFRVKEGMGFGSFRDP